MNDQERQRLERRALLLKFLAHPSRLLIIELLEQAPRCVADLTEAVGADKTTISMHLRVLKSADLVRDKKRGTWSDYELVCGCVSHFVDCIESGMGEEAALGASPPSRTAAQGSSAGIEAFSGEKPQAEAMTSTNSPLIDYPCGCGQRQYRGGRTGGLAELISGHAEGHVRISVEVLQIPPESEHKLKRARRAFEAGEI